MDREGVRKDEKRERECVCGERDGHRENKEKDGKREREEGWTEREEEGERERVIKG
jgi:hypothetical protein